MNSELAIRDGDALSVNHVVQNLQAKERETLLKQIGGGIKLTPEQITQLRREATHEIIDLLPTGEIYVPGDKWRKALNDVFSPMGWGYRASTPQLDVHEDENKSKSIMYREVFLVVSRCTACLRSLSVCECKKAHKYEAWCVSTSYGAQAYHPNNKRMTYDDAAEGASTNGLMRCCKPFGLYENIWDKAWAEAAKAAVGIRVTVRESWGSNKIKQYWRRRDGRPLIDEVGEPQNNGKAPVQEKTQAPQPAQTVSAQPAKGGPEKILVCRPVNYKEGTETKVYWVVNTDADTYVTNDADLVRALEAAKSNGKRIRVEWEAHGQKKKIIEFKEVSA